MRGRYSTIRFHMKEMHTNFKERLMWKMYWYARRKELNNPDTKISEYQPQAFIGGKNDYKITHDNFYTKKFYNYRSEIVKAKLPPELQ